MQSSWGTSVTVPSTCLSFCDSQSWECVFSPRVQHIPLSPQHLSYLCALLKLPLPWAFVNTVFWPVSLGGWESFSLLRTLISVLFTCSDSFTSFFIASCNERDQMFQPSFSIFLPLPKIDFIFLCYPFERKCASCIRIKQTRWVRNYKGIIKEHFRALWVLASHPKAIAPCTLSPPLRGSKLTTSAFASAWVLPLIACDSLQCFFRVAWAETFCWNFCRLEGKIASTV